MSADWLQEVFKLHNDWLKIAKVYGAGELAEDFVQDTYIKLHKYAGPDKVFTEGRINKGYVFFTLKTVVMEHHKNKAQTCDEVPECEGMEPQESDFSELWERIDAYAKANYTLPKHILYKMWRGRYSVREIAYCTDVSTPTIVKDLKEIKDDINKRFKKAWEEAKE